LVVAESAHVNGRRAPAVQGNFTPTEALNLLLAGSGITATPRPEGGFVLANTSSPTQLGAADSATPSEEVVIVPGAHIRDAEDGASPVLRFGRQALEEQGDVTLEQFARRLPQNFNSMNQSTSSVGNAPNSGDNTSLGAAFNLRGLGAESTLTLV